MDDDIRQFAWAQLRSKANVFIRQPRFLEVSDTFVKCHCHILSQSVLHGTSVTSLFAKVDFATLENFLAESELNCHEWELAQALRRWVIANEAELKCHEEEDETDTCAHQLLEALRWDSIPLKEAVIVAGWNEFKLSERDPTFLPDLLLKPRPSQSFARSATEVLNQQYSHNRLHNTRDDFVIYANLGVNLTSLVATCLHGRKLCKDSERDTHCQTAGLPFELSHYVIVPSYGLRLSRCKRQIEVLVNLACSGKSFEADGGFTGHSRFTKLKAQVTLTAFSFSPSVAARSLTQVVDFLSDTDSCHLLSLTFPRQELSSSYIHEVENIGPCMDLQISVISDLSHLTVGERKSAKPSLMKNTARTRRAAAPGYNRWEDWGSRENDMHRINSVGRTMQRLRCREGVRDVRWQDGWGNVARSPQWRSPDRNALGNVEEEWAEVQQWEGNNSRAQEQQNPSREDLSIEVMSPEYLEQSEAFGDITRSPQSPEWHADDSPASPEPWQRSPSPARSRSPSPGEGPSHSRWPPRLSIRDPRVMTSGCRTTERDPRKRARRHSPANHREEGLPGFNFGGPLYPSVQRSPSPLPPSPTYTPFSPPFSPHHESTEAAAGSRPGSPTGQVSVACTSQFRVTVKILILII